MLLELQKYLEADVGSSFQVIESHIISVSSSKTAIMSSLATFNGIKHPVSGSNSNPKAGEIHVIIGPMFAGKTTALLRRIKSDSNNGSNVVMIKSSKDTRYAVDEVVTHDGTKFPCWALPDLSSFKIRFGSESYKMVDVIGIDEAQFFDDLYDFCCEAADLDGKTLIIAGLDGDYLRRRFGSVLDIIPLANTVQKLTARCEICGKRASFTFRKIGETQTELIGGSDMYMPLCRQHYVIGITPPTTISQKEEEDLFKRKKMFREEGATLLESSYEKLVPFP
ncbi:unnamed protein product [Cuscuta europaea]|uniref:Thymidine kinase n=1 Tax=Cuscuta europaea TaxID=41803 RepID=A0A9P0YJ17_CUSEU|nr:unnamed protein product [Cuscuta europaea]